MNAPSVAQPIPILLYHSITEESSRRYRPYALSPARFRDQMHAIASGGFHCLTVSEFAVTISAPELQLPERCLLITFDDGFDDVHRVAWPIMAELGLRATVFIVTAHIGGTSDWLDPYGEARRPLLAWPQIRELLQGGFEIGSHSHSHRQLDIAPARQAADEIRRSREVLEQGMGSRVTSFAYPHGHYSRGIQDLVRANGYEAGCAVKHAFSHRQDDQFALARVVISAETPVELLGSWIQGRGLPAAWAGERARTRTWRMVRRVAARVRRAPGSGSTPVA